MNSSRTHQKLFEKVLIGHDSDTLSYSETHDFLDFFEKNGFGVRTIVIENGPNELPLIQGFGRDDPSVYHEKPERLMAIARDRLARQEEALKGSKYKLAGFRYKFWDDPEDQKRILAQLDKPMHSEWMTRASVLKLCDFLYESGYGVARMEAIRAPYGTTPRNHGYEVTGLDGDEMWGNHFDPGRARALVHKKIQYAIDDEAEFIYEVWAAKPPD